MSFNFSSSLSQLPRSLLAAEYGAATPFPSPPPLNPAASSLRPSITILVGILTTMFSLTFLLLLYAKHCRRHVNNTTYSGNPTAFHSSAANHRNSGVERTVVESLPAFRFGSLRGQKDGLECAVCLNRFEPAEVLRLLPKCKHAFHVECVDVWLDAHSTCPLCRVRVDPEDVLLVLDSKPESEPDPDPNPNPNPTKGRRISGRHSSAGEKSSKSLQIAGKGRKDGLLMTETAGAADREEFERRFSHRIVVTGGGERWSDVRPSDLMFLRSEMILKEKAAINARSVSEITGVRRFREEEERRMRKWMSRWLGE